MIGAVYTENMHRWGSLALAAVLLIGLLGTPAGSVDGYDLSIDGAVDIPDRQVTWNGTTFTIEAVKRANAGDRIRISTSAPAGTSYNVYLVDRQERIVEATSGNGSAQLTMDLYALDPGSYAVAIYKNEPKAVFPVVVRGYTVNLSAPTQAEAGQDRTITISLDQVDSAASLPHQVVVHLWNDSLERTVTASKQSGLTYEATLPLSELDPGSYAITSVVEADRKAFGRNAVIGINEPRPIEIVTPTPTPSPTPSPTPTPTTSNGGNGQAGSTATQPSTSTSPTPTPTPSTTTRTPSTPSPSPSTTTDTTTPVTDTAGNATPSATPTRSPSPADNTTPVTTTGTLIQIVTPGATTSDPSPVPSPGQHGMAPELLLAIIAAIGLLAWRRRPAA